MLTNYFNKKIKISLPNFHNRVFLNLCFILLQENNKDVFKNGIEITTAEGCFSTSIWSLKRDLKYISKHDMETTLNLYSKHNITVNYIFDNDNINEEDLYDNYSNLMLQIAHKEGNGVYVASELLSEYIKDKYPLYKIIKFADQSDFDKKDICIIDKYNNKFLKKDIKYKENAYITLNPLCPSDCKYYDKHRNYVSMEQKNYYRISDIYLCPLKSEFNFFDMQKHPNFISEEKLKDYVNAGFENFRIAFPTLRRCMDIRYGLYDMIESFIYYLIKPEHRQEIRHLIIRKFAGNKNG